MNCQMLCVCFFSVRNLDYGNKNMAASMERQSVEFFGVAVQFTEKAKGKHYLFVKEDQPTGTEDQLRPPKRTLFVANLPPYCSKECLERLFGGHGKITSIIFNSEKESTNSKTAFDKEVVRTQGYKSACIVYENPNMVEKTMKELKKTDTFVVPPDTPMLMTGLRKWCAEYISHRPDHKALQEEIDEYMQNYDQQKQQEKSNDDDEQEDEDGWVTVTKKTSKKVIGRTERQQQKLKKKLAKKREQTELINFYSFQMRQSKREHIAELRKKFEDDKRKIAEMKAARKFRPY